MRSRPGSYLWRKDRGLCTWRDLSRRWRFQRYTPAGYRSPAPWLDCRMPKWREIA